jgi:8-oxo-dGTP pyrophosphatase MutT (NUDIX family)
MNSDRGANLLAVAGVVLLRDDFAALLQLRDNKPGLRAAGKWVFPGGHCNYGEPIEECARRELREETGYDCRELHVLTSLVDDFEPGYPDHNVTFFWARFDGRQKIFCYEGQKLEFVHRKDAEQIPSSPFLARVWDQSIAELTRGSARMML